MDENFYNFLVNQAENKEWLKDMKTKYQENIVCKFCNSVDTKIIVSLKFLAKCKTCGEFSEVSYSRVLLGKELELADPEVFNDVNIMTSRPVKKEIKETK